MRRLLYLNSVPKYLTTIALTTWILLTSLQETMGQTYSDVAPAKGINIQNADVQWGGGVNFFDYDRDGDDDLTFADSLKFYNNTNGTLTSQNLIKQLGTVAQVLWFDFDNDGDNDLFVSYHQNPNALYENTGSLTFTKKTNSDIDLSFINGSRGVSVCDYNKDGYLDIYVANYEDANNYYKDTSRFNKLYRNNGDGTFTEVGVKAGVADGAKPSFQGIWIDYNDDGWQDLYVINDLKPSNSLYRNNQDGTFTEVTSRTNTGFPNQHPMSATAGDIDNNGGLDLFMSNSFLNTNTFRRESMLLKNDGRGNFSKKAFTYGVNTQRWSWGSTWVDYDNDTYQDLYITTAKLYIKKNYPLHKNQFLENEEGDTFRKQPQVFLDSHRTRSFAVAKGDLNDDGYYDLFVQNNKPKHARLWRNNGGSNHYIKVTLTGTTSNRMAIGSEIMVYVDSHSYYKYTKCGENYCSQNSQHKIFGLDTATMVDSLVVEYLSGFEDRYYNLSVDTHYYFKEGETEHISFDTLRPLCRGDSITLSIEASYDSISWSTNDTGRRLSIHKPGKYWANAWTKEGVWVQSDTVRVKEVPNIKAKVRNVSCHGRADGRISLTPGSLSGRLDPEFRWKGTKQATAMRDSVAAGRYLYTYADSTGCRLKDTVAVSEPSPLNTQTTVSFQQSRTDSAAKLTAVINGGTPPYEETLNGKPITTPVKYLPVDTYRYRVEDANGCSKTRQLVITRDSVPAIEAKVEAPSCYGSSDGRITLKVDSLPGRRYQIQWKGGNRGRQQTGLSAGQYVYRYSDDEGARYTDSVEVPSRDSLSLNVAVTPQTLTSLGSIKISPSGGTAPYTININGREVDSKVDELESGKYPVTVTDSLGCRKTRSVEVNDQRTPDIKAEKTLVSCHGKRDGAIRLNIDSLFYRTRNFTIQWQDGVSGPSRQGLSAGTYFFRYQDQQGIVVRDTVSLRAPAPIGYERHTFRKGQGDGCKLNIGITGGTAPYTIQWDSSYRANPVTDVREGHHQLTVSDENGCTLDTIVNIRKIRAPEIEANQTPASCAGASDGRVKLKVVAGVDSSVDVIWSDGYQGRFRDSLKAGIYHFTSVTANGCRYRDSVEVNAPYELNVQYRLIQGDTRSGAKIELMINGGTHPYSVQLDGESVEPPIASVASGEHTLLVSDARGCRERRIIEIEDQNPVGFQKAVSDRSIHGYPVPIKSGQTLKLHMSDQWGKGQRLKVLWSIGSVVYKARLTDGQKRYRINTAGWRPGVYLIHVIGQDRQGTLKVTVYE